MGKKYEAMRSTVVAIAALCAAAPASAFMAGPSLMLTKSGPRVGLASRSATGTTMQLNPNPGFRRSSRVALRAEGDDDVSGSPLNNAGGSDPVSNSGYSMDGMPLSKDAINPAIFVGAGVVGCLPIAYFLVQSCTVSLGFKLAQCPQ